MTDLELIRLCEGADCWHTRGVPELGLHPLMMSDGPHGLRKQERAGDMLGMNRSKPAVCFPAAVLTACGWDLELLREIGAAIAREALSEGVGLVLGPGANIKRSPLCGRNFEYFSEDPLLTGRLAAAFIEGLQAEGAGACLKHFACNNQEYKRFSSDSRVDERTLGTTTARRDGTFSLKVTLPEEGDLTLAVMTDTAEAMLAVHYEMPVARLVLTAPQETTFTGDHVIVRGETEPEATVYIEGEDMNTSVKANRNGDFSVRVYIEGEETQTFTLRTRIKGYQENSAEITLTREFTLREGIADFRKTMQPVDYAALTKTPEKYDGTHFTFRGRVEAFTDYNGSPCALVCVDNVAIGVWKDPVWVVLTGEEEGLSEGCIATFYLSGEGITLPAAGEYTDSGVEQEAPVAAAKYVTEITEAK